jgi:WS/DGAT/MGAT family acyltransferase
MSIDRLTGEDRLMLTTSEAWPQDVAALALLDADGLFDPAGRFRIEAVRDAVERRLPLVPRFRQVIHAPRSGLGGPLWVDARAFDVAEHVRELPLETPAGEAEVLLAVEQIRQTRLDPSRPLWEMWFLTGLPDRQVWLFVRIHHSIADGLAALAMVGRFLDPDSDAPLEPPPPWASAPMPSSAALLADNLLGRARGALGSLAVLTRPRATLRRLREVWPATRELLAEQPATLTSLNRVIGPDRGFALVRGSFDAVRKVARAHDATVNDVLLAVTAGGVRALFIGRGQPVEGVTVRIFVPVSLRRTLRGEVEGTLIAQMVVPISLSEPDPVRRLEAIAAETTRRKARTRATVGSLLRGRLVRKLALMAVIRQRANVITASVPGPRRALFFAGAQVVELFPLLALIGNVPLGVGTVSYAGRLGFGIVADRAAIPDIDVLAAGVGKALRELEAAAPAEVEAPAMAGAGGRSTS